jgi:hypothetical protein
LHEKAASDYAKRQGYDPVVVDEQGYPQSQYSPQAKAALKAFLDPDDQSVAAFYGFSGGGYNVRHILEYLAANEPQSLRRIKLVVVIGAPFKQGKKMFSPARYSALVSKKAKSDDWQDPEWEVVYRENPKKSQMPKGLEGVGTHMFGPDVLLTGWPEDN